MQGHRISQTVGSLPAEGVDVTRVPKNYWRAVNRGMLATLLLRLNLDVTSDGI